MEYDYHYPPEFLDLLGYNYASDSYIGQGNPASKILIVGKECSCDKDNYDVRNNAEIWRTISPENIKNWFDSGWDWKEYHPRQPFKGQLFLRDNKNETIEKNNRGTSVTWMSYQKFINMLLPKDLQVQAKHQLNFYEYCFLTELSSYCLRTSKKNPETKKFQEENSAKSANEILSNIIMNKQRLLSYGEVFNLFDLTRFDDDNRFNSVRIIIKN